MIICRFKGLAEKICKTHKNSITYIVLQGLDRKKIISSVTAVQNLDSGQSCSDLDGGRQGPQGLLAWGRWGRRDAGAMREGEQLAIPGGGAQGEVAASLVSTVRDKARQDQACQGTCALGVSRGGAESLSRTTRKPNPG